MNLGSLIAVSWFGSFFVLVAVGLSYEARWWWEERGWRADEERAVRMLSGECGLSDAVLAAIPDDELTDVELERKVRWEARRWGEFVDARLEIAALPEVEPRRRLAS